MACRVASPRRRLFRILLKPARLPSSPEMAFAIEIKCLQATAPPSLQKVIRFLSILISHCNPGTVFSVYIPHLVCVKFFNFSITFILPS